jgi:hypothetical protein
MVQMQTLSIPITPRQGRDMARILFTSQRTGKNIYTVDLAGCGTCPLCHVCVDWHLLPSCFRQSILHDSPDVIDEIVVDYHSMTASLIDESLPASFFASLLPFFALSVLPNSGRVFVPATDAYFDRISQSLFSWSPFFILRFICEEFVEQEISLVGGSSEVLPVMLTDVDATEGS